MAFTEEQMNFAISKDGVVKDAVSNIKESCRKLQENTDCPDEDVDDLLDFLIGRWK